MTLVLKSLDGATSDTDGTFSFDANGPLATHIRARLAMNGGSANITAIVAGKE